MEELKQKVSKLEHDAFVTTKRILDCDFYDYNEDDEKLLIERIESYFEVVMYDKK